MKSDAELFGLGKGKRLKFGETGNEADDYEAVTAAPEMAEAPEKQPKPFNESADAVSYTKPTDVRVEGASIPGSSDIAPNTQAASASISSVGHNGTTTAGLNREAYRDKWMSSGVKNIDQLKQWLAANGGELVSDNGTVMTPFGEQIDMLGAARTGNGTAAWTGVGDSDSAPPLEDIMAGGGNVGALASGASSTAGTPSGLGNVNDELARILAGGVDSDPALAAYRRSAARDFGKLRANAAEQAAQGGTVSSGGEEGRIRQLKEGEAEAVAGFAGDRAAQVQQLKVQSDQVLRQLGFNYDSLNQQQRQWLGNLNQNRDQFLASLGLSERQLSAQQRQALDQLGFMYDQLEANQNNIAADRALGR